MKTIVNTWRMLNKPIYVGERLKANLKALTAVSFATAALGLILIMMNIINYQPITLIASIITLIASAGCAYCAGVKKDRELAGLIPTVFCGIAFTLYTLTGVGQGTAILWAMLLPIGVSYFVSVRNGLILSTYYTFFFFIVFHSPLGHRLSAYYSEQFMLRFPLLFAFVAIFTGIAMIQYHRTALFEIEHTNRLNEEVEKQTHYANERAERLQEITEGIVRTLAHTIDAKDKYTNGHSIRVSEYAVALGRALGWSDETIAELRWEAMLHDIGKVGVPDAVLNKPGRLTDEEFDIIKSHTTIGGDILDESKELHSASETARYHHERFDGRGYPQGLEGEEIPVRARVVAIADAYDAMHSDRIYRKGLSHEAIRAELIRGKGTQWDPCFLDAFYQLFESGELEERKAN